MILSNKTAIFLFSTCIFAYVFIRSITVGITYDEAWTIQEFVPKDWINILNFTPADANNHLLNTLLIKTLYLINPFQSLFIARMPNVVAFGMYLLFAYKICQLIQNQFIGTCTLLLLTLNPFLLDFFSLARGYGLSFGFLLPSIYFLLKMVSPPVKDAKKINYPLYALIFASLSVLANFSMLNYWIVLFGLTILHTFYQRKRTNLKKTILFQSIISILLLAIIYEPIRKLRKQGNLYYGGSDDFYHGTLVSLAKYSFYSTTVDSFILISLNIFIVIFISSLVISSFKTQKILSEKNIILLVLLLTISSIILQFFLFKTLYLIDRTALFLYPIIILVTGFSLQEIKSKWITKSVIGMMTFLFLLNFLNVANLNKTATWYFDAHTEQILDYLDLKAKKENKIFKIDYSWPFQSSMKYYLTRNNYTNLLSLKNSDNRYKNTNEVDFYILLNSNLEKVGYTSELQEFNKVGKDILFLYKDEKIIVFSKK